jgi:hypothetical protein
MEWKPIDIITMIILFPLMVGLSLAVLIYYVVRFPLWWVKRLMRTKKRWLKWRDIDVV